MIQHGKTVVEPLHVQPRHVAALRGAPLWAQRAQLLLGQMAPGSLMPL